jgi:DNA-binding MarR family transcriptional regulator
MKENYFEALKSAFRAKAEITQEIEMLLKQVNAPNINASQFVVLKDLGDRQLTSGQIENSEGFYGKNPHYILTNMFKNGYVAARGCAGDKRKVYYKLSAKGKDLCDKIDQLMQGAEIQQKVTPQNYLVKKVKSLLAA